MSDEAISSFVILIIREEIATPPALRLQVSTYTRPSAQREWRLAMTFLRSSFVAFSQAYFDLIDQRLQF